MCSVLNRGPKLESRGKILGGIVSADASVKQLTGESNSKANGGGREMIKWQQMCTELCVGWMSSGKARQCQYESDSQDNTR